MLSEIVRLLERLQRTDKGYRRFGATACLVAALGCAALEVHAVSGLLESVGVGVGVGENWVHLGYSLLAVGLALMVLAASATPPLETQINWLRPIFEHPKINVRFQGTPRA